jgi:hypothetical protein
LVEIAFVEPNGAKSRSTVVGADTGLYDRFVLQATTGIDPLLPVDQSEVQRQVSE